MFKVKSSGAVVRGELGKLDIVFRYNNWGEETRESLPRHQQRKF